MRWPPTSSGSCGSRWAAASPTAALRVWAPQGAQVLFVRQVVADRRGPHDSPARDQRADRWLSHRLVGRRVARLPRRGAAAGEGRRARSSSPRGCSSRSATTVVAQGLVKAMWSNDDTLTTRINPAVAHYTGQAELADGHPGRARGEGRRRHRHRDRSSSVGPCSSRPRPATTRRRPGCKKIVEIDDAGTGTVRLRRSVRQARRDGARHGIDQDHAGQEMSATDVTVAGTRSGA